MFPETASRDPRSICCRSADVCFGKEYYHGVSKQDFAGVFVGGGYILFRQIMDFKYFTEEETNCISGENTYFACDLGSF